MKKYYLILMTVICAVFIIGCSGDSKDKTYSSKGFSIKMEDGFYEKTYIGATVYFESSEVGATALKEEFTALSSVGISKSSTIEDYLKIILTVNQLDSTIQTSGSLKYFVYEKEVSGSKFYYFATAVKGSDSFWLTQFFCREADKSKYESLFQKWAKTIEVD